MVDLEWGSEEQIEAENNFFSELEKSLPKEIYDDLCEHVLAWRCTTEDMANEGMARAAIWCEEPLT